MYKDIIHYELAEGISKEHLLKVAKEVVDNWMKKQEGFLNWEIHKNSNGGFTDIVYWQSEEDAKNAEQQMVNISNATDWQACYKQGSITSEKLTQIAKY